MKRATLLQMSLTLIERVSIHALVKRATVVLMGKIPIVALFQSTPS